MTWDFNEIYEREYKRIFLMACSYMKNVTDSEDVCQITFEKYLKYKPEFESISHEQAWFMKTAINVCKNILAMSWKKKTTYFGEYDIFEVIDNNTKNVEQNKEDYGLIIEIQKLPLKYREVIHLFYYDEYSIKEISEILGIGVSAVTTRLSRARKKLGDKLGDKLERREGV